MEGITTLELRNFEVIENVSFTQLVNLQPEEYKDLTDNAYAKLRNSFIALKFSFPFFVWQDPTDNTLYTIDGHQRLRVLKKMQEEGIQIPLFRCIKIEAANRIEAKKLLLAQDSQYGKRQREGLDMFLDEPDFQLDESIEDWVAMPDMEYFDEPKKTKEPQTQKAEHPVICPSCGHQFVPQT